MNKIVQLMAFVAISLVVSACGQQRDNREAAPAAEFSSSGVELSDAELDNLVRRSYQYVALYNVNNKQADLAGGWNRQLVDTQLKDHTLKAIARPNNDTLYITAVLDLRKEPVIMSFPAFESTYVSLMVTGYDHYVNVPLSSRKGDFVEPVTVAFYTERTEGYAGEPIKGVDRVFEMSGDLVSAILRVMPHAAEPERFKRVAAQMEASTLQTLSEFRGGTAKPIDDLDFPPVGETDFDVFENNLLEVMQFVFNVTSFSEDDSLDQAVLAAYRPLGIEPGKAFDPGSAVQLDGERVRAVAQGVAQEYLAMANNAEAVAQLLLTWGAPKGKTTLDGVVAMSVLGPIGLPAEEANYPPVVTNDGKPMNAMNDYIVRMDAGELPPAQAFWSITLYDLKDGFFIPNDRKKYSVGENAGMRLDDEGGITIYIAAEQPEGVPPENWLPINREDLDLSMNLRIYVPDLERMKTWSAPRADLIE